jgi:hypothetical protein
MRCCSSVICVGAAAASIAMPILWFVTPTVAALVYISARRAARVPVRGYFSNHVFFREDGLAWTQAVLVAGMVIAAVMMARGYGARASP